MLIFNARVIAPDGLYDWLQWDNGKITALGRGSAPVVQVAIDAGGQTLLPGFIDLHIHGAAGHDVMDADPQALREMARFCAMHGVTGWLPTTLTDRHEKIMAALTTVRSCIGQVDNGATILGARVEGPYLNREKAGAQNPQYIRLPKIEELRDLFDTGVVRLIDVAPEFDENRLLIEEAVRRGIAVSIAHSSATAEQTLDAVALGVAQSTHTYNAQTPLSHRAPGIVGAVLATPGVRCELIADNIHVHPLAIRVLWLCKGAEGVILITDAVRAAGMPDGQYEFDERHVLLSDGAVRLPDGTLAGSVLTMERALQTLMFATGEPLENVWRATSLNAACAIGLDATKGSLEVGKDADLVLLDAALQVQMTVVNGNIVYARD